MSEFTYDMVYLAESIANISFKIAILYLIYKYIQIRRLKQ